MSATYNLFFADDSVEVPVEDDEETNRQSKEGENSVICWLIII